MLITYNKHVIAKPIAPKLFIDNISKKTNADMATILKTVPQNALILTFASQALQRVAQSIRGNIDIPFSLQFGHILFICFYSSND